MIVLLMIVALTIVVLDTEGWLKRIGGSVLVVGIASLLITAVYILEKDEQAYETAEIFETTNIKITDVDFYKVGFVYWEDDDKNLKKGTMSWDEIVIGDQVALGLKEDVEYILKDRSLGREKVKYLKLTEEKLDELTDFRKK